MRVSLNVGVLALVAAAVTAVPAAAPQQTAPVQDRHAVSLSSPVVTRHTGTFGGRQVDYDAVVEPIVVNNAQGQPAARLVTMSYVAAGVEGENRPVLFAFNGGPITTSSLVHLGALGPRRFAIPDDITADPSTFQVVDNKYALLDVADLVFFDPASTGFSRTVDGIDPASFFSVEADGYQLAQLVIEWSKLHGRTESPKYLVGESYGTMRAVQAANQLQKLSMRVDGVALMGQAINIIEFSQRSGNVISHVVSLPTLAAIAWAHDRADRQGRTFDEFMDDARAYARGEYLSTLFLGNAATGTQRQEVARRLHEFTGIPETYFLQHDLKITKVQHLRELMPGQVLAVNDARYVGPADKGDPFRPVLAAHAKAFQSYIHDELKLGDLGAYLDNPVKGLDDWTWGPGRTPFSDWPYPDLVTEVLQTNVRFRVFVANGYYDTQTTIGAMEYLAAQARWPSDRVKTACYDGGHMFYSVEASLAQFSQDLRQFILGLGLPGSVQE